VLNECKLSSAIPLIQLRLQRLNLHTNLNLSHTALYHQLNRLCHKLVKQGYLNIVNPKGSPLLFDLTPQGFDLFLALQNSNHTKERVEGYIEKAHPLRIKSVKMMKSVNMANDRHKDKLKSYFESYIDDCNNKVIILRKKKNTEISSEGFPPFKVFDYETRFNSEAKQLKTYAKYHDAWDIATQDFDRAVHLVLTTDPKRFKSLYEANKHFSVALNRFMAYLTKKMGYRPRYISVYEYTKSGLMHAHLVIFGIRYLMPHHQITEEWERCGQGSYNYIYALNNVNGEWHYVKGKPKDLKKGESLRDYLKKYLSKAIFDPSSNFFYWVFNKRFYTCSRCFNLRKGLISPSFHVYELFTVCDDFNIPLVVTRSFGLYTTDYNKPP